MLRGFWRDLRLGAIPALLTPWLACSSPENRRLHFPASRLARDLIDGLRCPSCGLTAFLGAVRGNTPPRWLLLRQGTFLRVQGGLFPDSTAATFLELPPAPALARFIAFLRHQIEQTPPFVLHKADFPYFPLRCRSCRGLRAGAWIPHDGGGNGCGLGGPLQSQAGLPFLLAPSRKTFFVG